jgi:SAM-dependent methyltransferase
MGPRQLSGIGALAVEWFEKLCEEYPQYPTVALWRAWEMALFSTVDFAAPVLDLGCGDGRIARRLLGVSPERRVVFGLDLDEGSARTAASTGFYAGALVADARSIPLAAGAFASLLSVCVLEHIPDVAQVLTEAHRVLKPGGLFAFSVPTDRLLAIAADSHPPAGAEYAHCFCDRVAHQNSWDLPTWTSALERAGLHVEQAAGFMPDEAARAWFSVYDWVVKPVRGRGALYRVAGPGLRRFGLGHMLAGHWFRRLRRWAAEGVRAPLQQAGAMMLVARKPEAP